MSAALGKIQSADLEGSVVGQSKGMSTRQVGKRGDGAWYQSFAQR